TYCVAKPSSSETALQNNYNFACGDAKVNCQAVKVGGACYQPDTLINHASVAMNLYYRAYGRNQWNCDFAKSGLITYTDPSKLAYFR
ncbi:glucan endo-1 3-beta-d-glucosidase, partial [Phtheirospermum japonicum]